MALLLDTCAVLWIFQNQPVLESTGDLIDRTVEEGGAVYVSPITAWELGMLASRGRLALPTDPQRWFDLVLEAPGVRLARISPSILISSSYLPGKPPKDPADRIFAATAREYGHQLVTRDRLLLEYAQEGHIQALAC
jgi:PIN domain nuclease of toxin-antitoxin system